jgi:gliding motility-associated-like protein
MKQLVALLCFAFWPQLHFSQNIVVQDNLSPEDLVNLVLANTPCASVSNISAVSGNFGDGSLSYGFFDRNGADFPFENGVVLSTGRASSAVGPNGNVLSETASGWVGDADLEDALSVRNTTNATILEFDFTPIANRISFDYIFASEEYNSPRPCDFSDGFAFLLKRAGVDEPFQNLAVVPNTNIPVKVTTVHPDFPGAFGCPAENEQFFDRLNGVSSPINFNGQTVALTASATVIPNVTYHIKLVIADEGNALFDSAIFLGGGSFSIDTDLGPDRTALNGNALCQGDSLVLDADLGIPATFQWFQDGVPLPGETNNTLTVTATGVFSVEVDFGSGCLSFGDVSIEFIPPPTVNDAQLIQCDDNGDGLTIYNLSRAIQDIIADDQTLSVTGFFLSQTDAENNVNPIGNPNNFSNSTPNQVVYARVASSLGCGTTAQITLQISSTTANNAVLEACDDDGSEDGFRSFNLSNADNQVLNSLPAGLSVRYYLTADDALLEQNALPTNFINTQPNSQVLFARVNNGTACFAVSQLSLIVHPLPVIDTEDSLIFCLNSSSPILLNPGITVNQFTNFTYLWSTGETTPTIQVSQAGTFTVQVFNGFGCFKTRTVTVNPSNIATIEEVIVNDVSDNNTVEIIVSGEGDYEFSIDNIAGPYQDSPLFERVPSGFHTVFVRDKNGCGIASEQVAVIGIPKFFTPNGDGFHDTWQLRGLPFEFRGGTKIFIFDRFGKLLKDLSPNGSGWDGTYNGNLMPSTDYWYRIELADGRTFKGNFTLKR